jgi:hypothetical protein
MDKCISMSDAGIQLSWNHERQWHTQEFCLARVQQIQLRTDDRQNWALGAVAP